MPIIILPQSGSSTALSRRTSWAAIRRWATRPSAIALLALVPATMSLAAPPAATQNTEQAEVDPELLVHTFANEGVALTDGRQTVLIDALFDEGVRGYRSLDDQDRGRLIEGALDLPPVALVLATHVHRDHFDADVVLDFLRHHPEARFIGTPQTAAALRSALVGDENRRAAETRIHGLLPREGATMKLDQATLGSFDGKVTLLNLHHGRDRDPPTENLGLLVEMAGQRALHIGDTEVRLADVDALPWAALQVDIGLFPTWFLVKSHYLQVTRTIDPEHVVALHVPAADAPASYFWPARSLDGLVEAIQTEFPKALVALRPGQRRSYSAAPPR